MPQGWINHGQTFMTNKKLLTDASYTRGQDMGTVCARYARRKFRHQLNKMLRPHGLVRVHCACAWYKVFKYWLRDDRKQYLFTLFIHLADVFMQSDFQYIWTFSLVDFVCSLGIKEDTIRVSFISCFSKSYLIRLPETVFEGSLLFRLKSVPKWLWRVRENYRPIENNSLCCRFTLRCRYAIVIEWLNLCAEASLLLRKSVS